MYQKVGNHHRTLHFRTTVLQINHQDQDTHASDLGYLGCQNNIIMVVYNIHPHHYSFPSFCFLAVRDLRSYSSECEELRRLRDLLRLLSPWKRKWKWRSGLSGKRAEEIRTISHTSVVLLAIHVSVPLKTNCSSNLTTFLSPFNSYCINSSLALLYSPLHYLQKYISASAFIPNTTTTLLQYTSESRQRELQSSHTFVASYTPGWEKWFHVM